MVSVCTKLFSSIFYEASAPIIVVLKQLTELKAMASVVVSDHMSKSDQNTVNDYSSSSPKDEEQIADVELQSLSTTDSSESYILVDIGANLTNKKYSRDLEAVIRRAKDAGKNYSFTLW